eukprot:3282356-Rhodomonas_salina.1
MGHSEPDARRAAHGGGETQRFARALRVRWGASERGREGGRGGRSGADAAPGGNTRSRARACLQ